VGVDCTPPNALAPFEGHLKAREGEGKGKKGREKERNKRDGRDERKHPPPEIKFWLRL